MAEAFLSLDARTRADILQTVAARSGRAAIIMEKDIGVCWVYDVMRGAAILADDAPEFQALIEEIRILETNANLPDPAECRRPPARAAAGHRFAVEQPRTGGWRRRRRFARNLVVRHITMFG